MRICMILSTPIPPREGIGFYVWNLSQFLTQLGHQVHIITRGRAGFTDCTVIDDITVWRPPFIPTYPFHVHSHGFFVDKLLRKLEPEIDLIHLHTPLVKHPRTSVPTIVTVHTPMRADVKQVAANSFLGSLIKLQAPVSYMLEQQLFDRAKHVTAVAKSVASELSSYRVNPDDVSVFGNGVDVEKFSPSNNGQSAQAPYALTVARLAPRKGLHDLIDAAAIVKKRFPNFRFLIAGSGPLEGQLRNAIDDMGLDNNVVLLGHVSDRAELVDLYRNATLFVHPAHYEGLPTVLLEAMASACPVVATAVSGALDVVNHRQNGMLVAPRSPVEMAQSIIDLLERPEVAKMLGAAAYETIQQQYSWPIIGRKYVACYEALLS